MGLGRNIQEIPLATMERLMAYPWPGNIREFQNTVERILQVSKRGPIRFDHLPEEVVAGSVRAATSPHARSGNAPSDRKGLRERLDQRIRAEILEALQASQGNVSRAAQALGLARNTLYRKMARLGI